MPSQLAIQQNQNTYPQITEATQRIEHDSNELWLESVQVAAIRGLMNWKLFLAASWTKWNEESDAILDYLNTYWFTQDKRLSTNAIRWQWIEDSIVETLLEDIWSGKIIPSEFCIRDPKELKSSYPSLSISKITLLQRFIERETMFDRVDLQDLSAQFPFAISKYNFFGRFIGWSEWSPQNGIRHLRTSTPFFIQMKAMIESLYNEERNFLQISSLSRQTKKVKKKDDDWNEIESEEKLETREVREEMQTEFQRILQACIEQASDMMDNPEMQQLTCISIPQLPYLVHEDHVHLEPKEHRRLSIEIMNWIFFGDTGGELMNRTSLSIVNQRLQKRLEKEIPRVRKKIREKKKARTEAYAIHEERTKNGEKSLKTENACNRIERELDQLDLDLKNKIRERSGLKSDKKLQKPIIKVLESKNNWKLQLDKFRKKVFEAREKGEKIIFTTFENDGKSIFSQYFDRAFAQRRSDKTEVWDILWNCGFLMSDYFAEQVRHDRVSSGTATRWYMRAFSFEQSTLNQSARYVVEELLPQKEDIKVRQVIDYLVEKMPTPGVILKAQLKYLVCQYFGKKTPNVDDYLVYTFENLISTDKDTILWLLNLLRQVGHNTIPNRCREISTERFHISSDIMDQFEVYVSNYKPDSLGRLPEVFEDRATLQSYLDLGLDSYGMNEEMTRLQELFTQWNGVVWVIDTTEYHPELTDDGEKSDEEESEEVWGNYIRPTERLARSFASHLMEWRVVRDLKDHSFVSVIQPSKEDKKMAKLIKAFFGLDMDVHTNLSQMTQVISELHNYDENTVLVVNAESVKDFESYKTLLGIFEKFRFKVIVQLKEPLPWIPQITLKPFLDSEITARIMSEEEAIRKKLWLKDLIPEEIVAFAVTQVKRMRQPSDDPLNLVLQVINGAAQNARMQWYTDIRHQDITTAIVPIFHLPDSEQMKSRIEAVDNFKRTAPIEVLWQAKAVGLIADKMKSHILWLRDPSRPLSLLLPGPTWVGKTELMIKFAQAVNMPFFQIEGAEFSEKHTVSRLVGSPSWYVWPDKWILFKFLENNNGGVVFIDEIEKMHPAVYTALMNFFDKATLTAWDGSTVRRPWFVIVGASNAWADDLTPQMSVREVKDTLAQAFVDQFGKPRPELVRRFDPIVMLAIEKEEFKKVISLNLESIWNRFGLINSNVKLVGVDDVAVELLYKESIEVCKYSESSWFGFSVGKWAKEVDTASETFYDMRHISRALDTLVWDGLAEIVEDQIKSWRYNDRNAMTEIELVGDIVNKVIHVEVKGDA